MNFKKKTLIVSIFFILIIQILLLINNRQKTSFRYFIWNVEEVSIGRLVFISFMSGLFISSLLNKTLNNDVKTYQNNDEFSKTTSQNDNSLMEEDIIEFNEIPPERDLRDTQPTISVNYRVVKDNRENEIAHNKQKSNKPQYNDDWNNKDLEW